jgi:membrane fusion protein (multidrug efflux system)
VRKTSVAASAAVFAILAAAGGGLALVKYRQIAASMAAGGGYEPAETVEVVEAREIAWQPTAELVGTVFALRSVRMSNEVAGRVVGVHFESGAVIEAGAPVLTLDAANERADLAAAEAAVRVAEANVAVVATRLRFAEFELGQIAQAAAAGAATDLELERRRSEVEQLRAEQGRLTAEVEQAKARVAQMQARLEKFTILAPFRARAGIRTVDEGQFLAEGTEFVRLEEVSDRIHLDFAIPQDYLARVRPGLVVLAWGDVLGPDPVPIEVVAIDASVSDRTRNVRVRGIVDNRDERLRPGMFVRIRVPTDAPQPRIVVPATAVRRASFADQVYLVLPGEKPGELRASARYVTLGPSIGEDVVVLDGVRAGDRIAARGSFKLRDGALVQPAPTAAPDAASTKASSR